jgi:CubicO group peptidase (beta-lactamase class C family)
VNVRSIRKSLISALYGIGVAEGRIRLDQTIGELGIDDRPPSLSEFEKQATIRDLLTARSEIYHAGAYETPDAKAKRPQRGSHPPGSYWYYNNWDFNTLGFIYQRLVGENVFQAFEQRIGKPISMEDFSSDDGKFVFEPSSDYPAYTFRLTARDLARFGWLFLNRGMWSGTRIVPADWVDEATNLGHTRTFLSIMVSLVGLAVRGRGPVSCVRRELQGAWVWRPGLGGCSPFAPSGGAARRRKRRRGADRRRARVCRAVAANHGSRGLVTSPL